MSLVGNGTGDAAGLFRFIDSDTSNRQMRFYSAVSPLRPHGNWDASGRLCRRPAAAVAIQTRIVEPEAIDIRDVLRLMLRIQPRSAAFPHAMRCGCATESQEALLARTRGTAPIPL